MSTGSPASRRRALSFLDARYIADVATSARQDVQDAKDSDTPLRGSLQTRSDFAFVDEAVSAVMQQGQVTAQTAEFIVHEVILDPTVCVMRKAGSRTEVLHAVIFERSGDPGGELDFDLRVVLRATVAPKQQIAGTPMQPPRAESLEITVEEVDLDVDRDTQLLTLVGWLCDFRTEGLSSREPPRKPMLFLGKPTAMQVHDVPDDWRKILEATADIFGYRARIQTDSTGFNGRIDKKTEWVFSFDTGMRAAISADELQNTQFSELTFWGTAFDEAVLEIMHEFREAAEREDEPPTAHMLKPGDVFFHRKVGDSKGGHDNFSERSATPICSHETGWRHFHGDKSRKGMARIYENFKNDMLYHCGKYPNCNVYQVRA